MEKFQIYFFTVLFLGVLFLSFQIFSPFLVPLSIAATLAFLFHPFNERLAKIFGGRRGPASFITLVLAVLVIIIPFVFIGTTIFREAVDFSAQLNNGGAERISASFSSISAQISYYFPGYSFNLAEYVHSGFSWLSQNIGIIFTGIAKVTIGFLLNLFICLIAFYYFLKDGQKLVRAIVALSPLPDKNDYEILAKLEGAVSSVVRGSLIVAVIQGILAWLGFTIFGVPSPALFGSFTAVAALIPAVGTAAVVLPAIIYLFAIGSTVQGVGLLIWGMTAIGLVDNILGPTLLKRGIKVHPFLILISVIGGLGFFGPIGFLLGPIVLSLLFAMIEIYRLLMSSENKSFG
ncbi:MAG: AI-2E family transporter [Patescibacteria group bacterium]